MTLSNVVSRPPERDPRSVITRLDDPVPLLGLRSQRLGLVHALVVSLDTGRVIELELHTPWQTLYVGGAAARFDAGREAFCLLPSRGMQSRDAEATQVEASVASS